MNEEKLLEIAVKLLERTRAGEIPWSETADTKKFSAAYPEYAVTISIDDYNVDYVFSVANEKGIQIESVDTDKLRGLGSEIFSTGRRTLSQLHGLARRQALKSDEILDDLLTRLSSDV